MDDLIIVCWKIIWYGTNAELWGLVFIVLDLHGSRCDQHVRGDWHPVNGFFRYVSSGRLSYAVEGKGLESLWVRKGHWGRVAGIPVRD